MKYAVQECYHAIKLILTELLVGEGRTWYLPCCLHIVFLCNKLSNEIYANLDYSFQKELCEEDLYLPRAGVEASIKV